MSYGDYPDLSNVKKILVIKLRHLGDVLLTTPFFSELKKALPQASIDVYVYKEAEDIVKGHPAIHRIFLNDRRIKKMFFLKRMLAEWKTLRNFRKQKYDMVINLTEGDRGALVCKLSKAKYKIGPDPHNKGFVGKQKAYTHLVRHTGAPRHNVEKNLDVLRRIGIFPKEKILFMHIPKEVKQKIDNLLFLKNIEQYIVIHPAARWKFKCWPYFDLLIVKLLKENFPIIITASADPEEKKMASQLSRNHSQIINLAGKLSLKEFAYLIQKAGALITVDSLPLHMASCFKTPVVALFGPTSEKIWGPWLHPQSRVLTSNHTCRPCSLDGCGGSKVSDCLHCIAVEEVFSALLTVMQETYSVIK